MTPFPAEAARAADRMQTLARRAPTPAIMTKARDVGRAVARAAAARRLPPGALIAGVAGLPPSEIRRLVAEGERKVRAARDLPPFIALPKGN